MPITIEKAKCLKKSDSGKAILVDAPIFDNPEWIPLSQVDDDSEVYKENTEGDLIISDWLAEKNGWD